MLSGLVPHHICFAVEDLEQGAKDIARSLGAGPFFRMSGAPFDELVYLDGETCTWRHEHAFGSLAGQTIELTRTLEAEPAELARLFANRPVSHLGYIAPDLEAASEQLRAAGGKQFLRARRGPVRITFSRVPGLGCIEMLQADEVHDKLSAALAARAADWDGLRPFRTESPF